MMADYEERQVGDMIVRIDRTLCVGFGDCVDENAPAFALAEDGIAVFHQPECVSRDALICVCESCPVDALSYVCLQETDGGCDD